MEAQFESHNSEDKQVWAHVQDSNAQRRSQNRAAQHRLSLARWREIRRQQATAMRDPGASSVTHPFPPMISNQAVFGAGGASAAMGWFHDSGVTPGSVQTAWPAVATGMTEATRPADVCEVDTSARIPETAPSLNATVADADIESCNPVVSDQGLKRTTESCDSRKDSKRARSTSTVCQLGQDVSARAAFRYSNPSHDSARDSQAMTADTFELKFRFGPMRFSLGFEGLHCIGGVTTQDMDGIV